MDDRPSKLRKIEIPAEFVPQVYTHSARLEDHLKHLPWEVIRDEIVLYFELPTESGFWKSDKLVYWGKHFVRRAWDAEKQIDVDIYEACQMYRNIRITELEFIAALEGFIKDRRQLSRNATSLLPVVNQKRITKFIILDQLDTSSAVPMAATYYHAYLRECEQENEVDEEAFKSHLRNFLNAIFKHSAMPSLRHVNGILWRLMVEFDVLRARSDIRTITCGAESLSSSLADFPPTRNSSVELIRGLTVPIPEGLVAQLQEPPYEEELLRMLRAYPRLQRLYYSTELFQLGGSHVLGPKFAEFMFERPIPMSDLWFPPYIKIQNPKKFRVILRMLSESPTLDEPFRVHFPWTRNVRKRLRINSAQKGAIAPEIHPNLMKLHLHGFTVLTEDYITPYDVTFGACQFQMPITKLGRRTAIASFLGNCAWGRAYRVTIQATEMLVQLTLNGVAPLNELILNTPKLKRVHFIQLKITGKISINSFEMLDLLHIENCYDLVIESQTPATKLELVHTYPRLGGIERAVEELLLQGLPSLGESLDRYSRFGLVKKVHIKHPVQYTPEDIERLKNALTQNGRRQVVFTVTM